MNCQDAEHALALAIEGDLAVDALPELEHHLEACARCRAWRKDLEESQAELKRWAEEPLDDSELFTLRAAILEKTAQETAVPDPTIRFPDVSRRGFTPRQLGRLAALLLVGLLLLIGFATRQPGPALQSSPDDPILIADRGPSVRSPLERVGPPNDLSGPAKPLHDEATEEPKSVQPKPPIHPGTLETPSLPMPEELLEPEPAPSVATVVAQTTPPGDSIPHDDDGQATRETETTLVKLISDDPDILIYWLIETEPTTEET